MSQKQLEGRTLAAGWLTNFAILNWIRDRHSVLMYIYRKFCFFFFKKNRLVLLYIGSTILDRVEDCKIWSGTLAKPVILKTVFMCTCVKWNIYIYNHIYSFHWLNLIFPQCGIRCKSERGYANLNFSGDRPDNLSSKSFAKLLLHLSGNIFAATCEQLPNVTDAMDDIN